MLFRNGEVYIRRSSWRVESDCFDGEEFRVGSDRVGECMFCYKFYCLIWFF